MWIEIKMEKVKKKKEREERVIRAGKVVKLKLVPIVSGFANIWTV